MTDDLGMCVGVFILRPLFFPAKGGRMRVLSSVCQITQADFTDSKSFLIYNLMEKSALI